MSGGAGHVRLVETGKGAGPLRRARGGKVGRRRITAGATLLGCAALDAAQVAVVGITVSLAAAERAPLGSSPSAIGIVALGAALAALARSACGRGGRATTGKAGGGEASAGAAGVLIAIAAIAACSLLAGFPASDVPRWFVPWALVSALVSAGLWSAAGRAAARGGPSSRRVAVVGNAAETAHVAGAIAADRERLGWTVVRDVRDAEPGQMEALRASAVGGDIDVAVLAMPMDEDGRVRAVGAALADVPVRLCLAIQPLALRSQRHDAGSAVFIDMAEYPHGGADGALKRVLDVALGSLAIVALAPVFALIAVAIRLDSPGPLLFRQRRFGVGSRPIQVLKFRTMRADLCDPTGERRTAARDPRVTRVGRVLRRTSLDELPQLFNVLTGDMSLVGPRPHAVLMKVGDGFYSDVVDGYRARHRVRPGITGWAQVNGLRGEVDSPEKARKRIQHDMWYIENWSLSLDLGILLRTLCGGFATFRAD